VLPDELRRGIFQETELIRKPLQSPTFDYDAFVTKAKDAMNAWAEKAVKVGGCTALFGTVQASSAREGPRAYNWSVTEDMRSLIFFDAQTGMEYTIHALKEFAFEPEVLTL